jgi:broad specificity phosphatase PhoE
MIGKARALLNALLVLVATASPAMVAADAEPCGRPTTLIVVRHADRQGSEDALSLAGVERARDLARVLAQSHVTAIYHSDTERTRLTAQPLAAQLGIEPVVLPGKDVEGLIRGVFRDHCGETVLIVGHSNTVPLIIAAAGGPAPPDLAEDAFDDMFVVTVAGGTTSVVNLKYGPPSSSE